MNRCITATLVAVFAFAGCGGDDKGNEQGAQATPTPTETPTASPTPTPDPDRDGDGVPDADDFAPKNAKIQTKADASDCDVLGINSKKLREGACTDEDGRKLKVVNRASTLTLRQMNVQMLSIAPTTEIAREYDSPLVGSFVVAEVAITNKLNSPVDVNAPDLFTLLLGNKTFTPNFDAMNDGSNPLIYEELQPDETATGKVIFTVAAKRVRGLDTSGNVVVYQFSDADSVSFGGKAKQRIGVIRTYH